MTHREHWRPVLEAELKRWSAMPTEQLISQLRDEQVYRVKFESNEYTVEVHLLENTPKHIHVLVAVDDGSLPASFHPLSDSFIRQK
jgi:hypothetical protein